MPKKKPKKKTQTATPTPEDFNAWVIPFKENRPPYQKKIDDFKKYIAQDELVIPFDILAKFDNTHEADLSYEEIRELHQENNQEIEIRQMQDPFGKGAFAKAPGIFRGSLIVYTGVYGYQVSYADTDRKDQVYLSRINKELLVDAKNMVNKARYLQHLPDDADAKMTAYFGDDIATTNITNSLFYCTIKLKDKDYVIPFPVLQAMRDIVANEILGYSYGNETYWFRLLMTPTIFNKQGIPLEGANIVVHETDKKKIQFWLNKEDLARFLNLKFVDAHPDLLFFPMFTKEIFSGKSNGAFLPIVCHVQTDLEKTGLVGKVRDERVLVFALKSPATYGLGIFLTTFNLRFHFVDNDENQIVFNLEDLTQLDLPELEDLFAMFSIIATSHFQFGIVKNPRLIKKIKSEEKPDASPLQTNSLFSPANPIPKLTALTVNSGLCLK